MCHHLRTGMSTLLILIRHTPHFWSRCQNNHFFFSGMIRHEPDETCDGSSGSQSLSADHSILNGATMSELCPWWEVAVESKSWTAESSFSMDSMLTSLRTSSNCWKAREWPDLMDRHLPTLWATNCSIVILFNIVLIQRLAIAMHHVNHWIDHHRHGHWCRSYWLLKSCVLSRLFSWKWAKNWHWEKPFSIWIWWMCSWGSPLYDHSAIMTDLPVWIVEKALRIKPSQ